MGSLLELVDPADLRDIVGGLAALEAGAPEVAFECQFRHRDGRDIYQQWVARPLAGSDLWWAAGRDTTDFHRLLAEQADLQAQLSLVVGHAGAAMWELDMRRGTLSWEPQAADLLGIAAEALPRTVEGLGALVLPADAAPLVEAMRELGAAGVMRVEVRIGDEPGMRHLSLRGKLLDRDHRERPLRAVGVLLDISSEKAMEEQMMRMVMTDALTGVPNRRAFDRALRGEWRRCARAKQPLSIVMVRRQLQAVQRRLRASRRRCRAVRGRARASRAAPARGRSAGPVRR